MSAPLDQQASSQDRSASRTRPLLIALSLVALVGAAFLPAVRTALALPPAGTDNLLTSGQVSVSSRLGQEAIPFTGTLTIQRSAPQLQGGVEVEDMQITTLSLSGTSVTGPVTVAQSSAVASTGQLRSLQAPPDQFPASSFFDVFVQITAPASPSPTITLHNDVALHVVPTSGGAINSWPPLGVTYAATPSPCVPLLPSLPKDICVTSLSFTLSQPVGGLARAPEIPAARPAQRQAVLAPGEPATAPGRSEFTALSIAGGSAAAAAAVAVAVGWWSLRKRRRTYR